MKALKLSVGLLALLCGAYLFGASGYHLIKKIPLGAAPGGGEYFDYIFIDNANRHVYLSHGTEMKILNADTYAEVATIGGTKRNRLFMAASQSLYSVYVDTQGAHIT